MKRIRVELPIVEAEAILPLLKQRLAETESLIAELRKSIAQLEEQLLEGGPRNEILDR